MLTVINKNDIEQRFSGPVDAEAEKIVSSIIKDVKNRGDNALYEYCVKYGDAEKGANIIITAQELKKAADSIPDDQLQLLKRTAKRIETFAQAQLDSINETIVKIPGGETGQQISPVERACCYAPGGRFPLPSSVLMTAVTAKVAGVKEIWVTSPNPVPITMAAAYVAGAHALVSAGGAQSIAAFAYGTGSIPVCDVIVGPGNKYVTAAKKLVFGNVAIDMLAGPSELTVLADKHASAEIIAADLLAQAEHDVVAIPILVTDSSELLQEVNNQLKNQLEVLTTKETASKSLKNGFAVIVDNIDEGITICNRLAPEHLEILTENAWEVSKKCNNYGGLFIGENSAEVFGDYGAGPNHTLPTGGTARYTGGLSVFDFLRIRTWIRIDSSTDSKELIRDCSALADLEGLHAHAEAARKRVK